MVPELKSLFHSILDDLTSETNPEIRNELISDLRLIIDGDDLIILSLLKDRIKKLTKERDSLLIENRRLKAASAKIISSPIVLPEKFHFDNINGC